MSHTVEVLEIYSYTGIRALQTVVTAGKSIIQPICVFSLKKSNGETSRGGHFLFFFFFILEDRQTREHTRVEKPGTGGRLSRWC